MQSQQGLLPGVKPLLHFWVCAALCVKEQKECASAFVAETQKHTEQTLFVCLYLLSL